MERKIVTCLNCGEVLADVIDAIVKDCGYGEDKTDEYFSSDFEEIIIDTDDFEVLAE